MPNNHGKLKEDEMYLSLNNKKVANLSPNLRYMLEEMFGALEVDEVITCTQPEEFIKPDLLITYKGKQMGLSMKYGTSNLMHSENIETFIPFLRGLGVSEETLKTIVLYQFGDGTYDGTGKVRVPIEELKYRMMKQIKAANDELNSNEELIVKVAERLIFQGVNKDAPKAEAIYHGDVMDGVIVTRPQIIKHIKRKNWNYYDNLHIGPLFLKAHARYIGKEVVNEKYRRKIDASWPRLLEDITYISKTYFSYTPISKRSREDW